MIDLVTLGKRFKQIRIYYGLNQEEVAKALGIKQAMISRVERGQNIYGNLLLQFFYFYGKRINLDLLLSDEFSLIDGDTQMFNKNIEVTSIALEKAKILSKEIDNKIQDAKEMVNKNMTEIIGLLSTK